MLKQGIYHVKFESSGQKVGEGLAVFANKSVNGGDIGYLYSGAFSENGDTISAQLRIKRWNHNQESVFGSFAQFGLTLAGTTGSAGETFTVEGCMTELPSEKIRIVGRHLQDLS